MMPADENVPGESVAVILARMEVKLDHALTRGEDHESRIRILERKVWMAAGWAAAAGGGISTALSQFLH